MKINSNSITGLFTVSLAVISVILLSVEWISQRNIPITENVYPIQAVTCVQSEYWICDVRIDDVIVLGFRSPVELQVGDVMTLVEKDNRVYLFGK